MRAALIGAFLLLLSPSSPSATTILVRPDGQGAYPTIQAAMDACASGDTIRLANGVYRGAGNHDLDPRGKHLRVCSSSDSPRDCVIDCDGTSNEPHRGFYCHTYEDIVIRGLTITSGYGASTHEFGPQGSAIMLGDFDSNTSAFGVIENCILTGSRSGPAVSLSREAEIIARDCLFVNNADSGVFKPDFVCGPTAFIRCSFINNGNTGAYVYYFCIPESPAFDDCLFMNNRGHGLSLVIDEAPVVLRNCRFVENDGNGLNAYVVIGAQLWLESCDISDNAQYGMLARSEFLHLSTSWTTIERNALGGVSAALRSLSMHNCSVSDNGGNGIQVTDAQVDWTSYELVRCRVTGNDQDGVRARLRSFAAPAAAGLRIQETLIAENGGTGLVLEGASPRLVGRLDGSTIVANGGHGILTTGLDSLNVRNSIFAYNEGSSAELAEVDWIVVECTDAYGNSGGDWQGDLSQFLGVAGNINSDPMFCGANASDYTLMAGSPCSPESNPSCGLIGIGSVACGLVAVPGDPAALPGPRLEAFPNPFNPMTTIRFDIPVGGRVRLEVYDVAGRVIRTLLDAALPAGSHEAVWDGKDKAGRAMASGSYFARLSANGRVETVRMGLVR